MILSLGSTNLFVREAHIMQENGLLTVYQVIIKGNYKGHR